MNKIKKLILIGISIVFSIPYVNAARFDVLEEPFRFLLSIFENDTTVAGFTLIFFFMLLYGIYATGLKFVPAFKSDDNLSRQGKVIGVSMSALSTLAIFFFTPGGIQNVMKNVLEPFGIFAGLALAALFAGITYFGIKGDSESRSITWAAAAAGFGMIIAGMITTYDSLMYWGFLIMLIALIFGLTFSRVFGGGNRDDDRNNRNDRDIRNSSQEYPNGEGQQPKSSSGDGLDWSNTGQVFVRVTDEDNSPISDVKVKIKTADKVFNKQLAFGYTNNNGIFPKNDKGLLIGEGHIKVIAEKTNWNTITWFNRGRYIQKPVFYIKGGEQNILDIQMRRKGEEHAGFEPKILNVVDKGDHHYLEGVIN